MRNLFRVIYFVVGVFLFLFIALIGYTQTRSFRDYLRQTILAESDKSLNGVFKFDKIGGNLLTGFTFSDIVVENKIGEVVKAEKITIKFDPFSLPFRRIVFSSIVIENPKIEIYRAIDGSWNFSNLIKPTPEDSTPSSWTIKIKNLEIKNAELIFTDSLRLYWRQIGQTPEPPNNVIDYARVHLHGFSLTTSLEIQPDNYIADIRELKFASSTPHFVLRKLSGEFLLSKNRTSAKNVQIETANSRIRMDAILEDIDITKISDIEELELKPVEVNLIADGIDTKDVKKFLYPSVDFLDGELSLQVKTYGTFETLNIEQLAIQMPHTFVQFKGKLQNLHHPKKLEIYVDSDESYFTAQEIIEHLPGLKLPDLSFLEAVKYSLKYEGKPLDFNVNLSINSAIGRLDVNGKMNIEKNNIVYSAKVETYSFNLQPIVHNEGISSDLNSKIIIEGSGFNPLTMTTLVKAEIDSSLFNDLPLRNSVFILDIADGTMRSHLAGFMGNTTYDFTGEMQFFSVDSINYNVGAKIRALDLSEILRTKQYKSMLSFDLKALGYTGQETRVDTIMLHFYPSSFEKEKFETADARIIFTRQDSLHNLLRASSSIGGLNIEGNFTLLSFFSAWKNSYNLISELIRYKARNIDSLNATGYSYKVDKFQPANGAIPSSINAQYRLYLDLKPIGIVLYKPINGYVFMDGRMIGDSNSVNLQGNMRVQQFGFEITENKLYGDTISIKYNIEGIGSKNILDGFSADLQPFLKNFSFNNLMFNELSGSIRMSSKECDFNLSSFVDSITYINVIGTAGFYDRSISFNIPFLKTEFDKFTAQSADTIKFILGSDGFNIQNFIMQSNEEVLSIAGIFRPRGLSNIKMSLKDFQLSDLKQILHKTNYAQASTLFSGKFNGTMLLKGRLDEPEIKLNLLVENVCATDMIQNKHKELGQVNADILYSNNQLNLLIKFLSKYEEANALPDLLISGTIPYDFTLVKRASKRLEGNLDLLIKSSGLNLEFVEPFIPDVSNLSGTIVCDMHIGGQVKAPNYEGRMSINNAKFIFNPIGLKYILNGNLIPDNDRIKFETFTIKNDPDEEQKGGKIDLSGYFNLSGLTLNEFDFLIEGDLLIMRSDKRISGQKLYGDLFIETGQRKLVWRGNITESAITGEIFIKEAYLILPPEREVLITRSQTVNRIFKDDTSKSSSIFPEEYLTGSSPEYYTYKNGKSVGGKKYTKSDSGKVIRSSFLDGIRYDLSIETKGPTQLRFIFNTQTREELFADLQGRLYYNRTPETSRLTGHVDVTSNSYYNFIKKFEAKGKLLFTGDMLNPELDVVATYEGVHRSVSGSYSNPDSAQISTSSSFDQSSKEERILVTLYITGSRNEPRTKITMATKGLSDKDWRDWDRGDDEANAISFIVSGQYRDELTEQQRMGMIGTNIGFALASGMVTGPLSEVLRRNTGFIQSVDVMYSGGQFDQSADIRLTGQYKDLVVRMGGRILKDVANTNVSIELPFSTLVRSDKLRNLILTLERRVEGIQTMEEQRRASNGMRLFYRITF